MDDGRQARDDEERPAKLPSRTYVEFILASLGFEAQDWTRMGDNEVVRFNTCAVRLTDEAVQAASLRRFIRQRERLNEWQSEAGNPILVEHRVIYDQDAQRNYSEYRVPLGELLRDIIADAPIGTRDHHLKQKIKRHVRSYLQRFEGTAKPVRRDRHPSPISDAHRGTTLIRKALENETRKSGPGSAANLICSAFRAEFGDQFQEIFGPTLQSDNYQQPQGDRSVWRCDKCGTAYPGLNLSSRGTYGKNESDQNSASGEEGEWKY
jgi:hypothetical protein